MKNIKKDRNINFDILKAIALLCIILAHVNPPDLIFQLRNFDVPLMIIISVWLSINSINKNDFNYRNYVTKRVKRLLIPTWIFLTIYFFIHFIIGDIISFKRILLSYSLISGIGYVWVIRIYVYIAIVTPFINRIYIKFKRHLYIIFSISFYIMYEVIAKYFLQYKGIVNTLATATVLDFMGYSFVAMIAIYLYYLNKKNIFYAISVFGGLFFLLAIRFNFAATQNFKYPVRLYYLAYAFFISLILYTIIDYSSRKIILKNNKILSYFSKNSMWIYLWHILYIDIINNICGTFRFGWIISYISLIILSVITTNVWNKLNLFISRYIKNLNVNKYKKIN